MKYINIKEYGGPEQLEIAQRDIPTPVGNEVLLKVLGFGINRADTVQRYGRYPAPKGHSDILGLEAFGVLPENPNQYYCALLNGGGYAEYVTVQKEQLIPLPKNVDNYDAPGLAEVWVTAYQLVKYIGNLKDNQSVLIYAGASGVGTSAIQLAQFLNKNVKIFYTVSSQDKIDICQKLGATKGYNYKSQSTEDIVEDIKTQTNQKGIDLVLDCVGGSNAQLTTQSLGVDSTWVQYGLMGGAQIKDFSLAPILGKRISLVGTTLRSRTDEYKADLIQNFVKDVVPGFESQQLKFLTDKVFNLNWESNDVSPVIDAHNLMESNQTIGKVLINAQK